MMSTCPAWRVALEGALDHGRHSPETRYVQVATVRPDSCPANRTLVFRAFFDPGHQLVFNTDLRTAKVTYLETNPGTEACWYFVLSREQFRIAGRAMVCAQDGETEKARARLRAWREMSDDSRQAFTWPTPGGSRAVLYEFARAAGNEPPLQFALWITEAQEVDHLELR